MSAAEVILMADCAVALADAALATNYVQACERCGLSAVPDVVILQAIANGEESPNTWRIRRATDGREVYFFGIEEACR